MELKRTEAAFRPKARIMELLGEQLIKSHTLALFELVKNSYDADAKKVSLTLLNIDEPEGEIEIEDDGAGMDFKTVVEIWMEPAHGHKAEKRKNGERTKLGRLPVGEKGVGRFAVHRLGRKICMVTKTENNPEVYVEIDWDNFSKNEYLDQAKLEIYEREPRVFKSGRVGTRITVSNLKQTWRRGEVRKVFKSVAAMTPAPRISLISKKEEESSAFEVQFVIEPDKGWLENLFDPSLAESQSLFSFDFELNDEGLKYNYGFTPLDAIKADYKNIVNSRDVSQVLKAFEFFTLAPPGEGETWRERRKRSTRPVLEKKSEKIGLGIGPIKGKIIGFDFDKEIKRYIKDERGGLEEYVKEQGGIRVYRDGLRVYNYGEPGDDWLNLDHRRIQQPSQRFGNKQIIGEIHLDLEESFGLLEKTSREGFVENKAYDELVYAMTCILAQFEAERNKDKQVLKNALSIPPGAINRVNINKKSIEELITELETEVLKRNEIDAAVGPLVRSVSKAYKETRDAMLSAAGAGLGLVTVFHELERGIRGLHKSIIDGTSSDTLGKMSNELVSLLQGAMYMVSNKNMEDLSASRLAQYALLTQERRFKRHKITFLNGFSASPSSDFTIRGMRRMLTSSLVNIIDNAIYWLDASEEERFIWIGPSLELEGPSIVVADNGPGFIDDAADIVQPFFTRKAAGMGIGLYYTDMVMKSHSGRLAFPENGSIEIPAIMTGAKVAMVFNLMEKK